MTLPRAPSDGLTLAVTLGDPRGVGPEVAVRAARAFDGADRPSLLFIGPTGTGAEAAADAFEPIGEWRGGSSPAEAGRLAGLAIEKAVRFALAGDVAGIVTAPIDKAALHAAGYDFPGHTEMLASLSGTAEVSMLMSAERSLLGGPLRVVLATTHMPLSAVPHRFTQAVLEAQTRLTVEGLREGWALAEPRVALCAFNPHASDGGLFGDEEETVYGPVIDRLRADNIRVNGPIPADTVFLRAGRGEFDVVIAPYHDVGMAAFKTACFGGGVNVTLGLPFVRTSPDHGTALDIAGSGRADAGSMLEALRLADRLARNRSPAKPGR